MADTTDDRFVTAIGEHVVKHVGPVTDVFHERVSDIVPIDVLVIGPDEGRPFTTLVTCGMSERPMRVPLENPDDLGLIPELRYAELLLALPPEWPVTPAAFEDEANYWPVRWLKRLARLRVSLLESATERRQRQRRRVHSMILGTRKVLPSCSGASASTFSRGRLGRGSSGRIDSFASPGSPAKLSGSTAVTSTAARRSM